MEWFGFIGTIVTIAGVALTLVGLKWTWSQVKEAKVAATKAQQASELARRAHVSRQWISEFEAGKPTAELGLVIRLLDALELRLTVDSGEQRQPAREESAATVDLDAVLDDYRSR